MKKFFAITTAILGFSLLTGCVGNKYGAAYIVSNPPGAEVINLDDGTLLGVTPLKQVWRDDGKRKFVNIQLDKDGYKDKATSFWLTLKHRTRKSAVNDPQFVEVIMDSTNSNSNSNSTSEDSTNALQ